jgi:hypothetical protein
VGLVRAAALAGGLVGTLQNSKYITRKEKRRALLSFIPEPSTGMTGGDHALVPCLYFIPWTYLYFLLGLRNPDAKVICQERRVELWFLF